MPPFMEMVETYFQPNFLTISTRKLTSEQDDSYLFTIAALHGDGGNVLPAELLDDFHHGRRLEVVWRHDATEELEAGFVRQFCGRRGVADLGNLPENKNISG